MKEFHCDPVKASGRSMSGGQRDVYPVDGAWRRNKLIDGADAGENKRDAPLKLLQSFTGLKLLLFQTEKQ